MPIDPWFPVGFGFSANEKAKLPLYDGGDWQIVDINPRGRVVVAKQELANKWIESGLLAANAMTQFKYGADSYSYLLSGEGYDLEPISAGNSPGSKNEALAFADAFRRTREIDKTSPLHDAIYVEKLSRLLPTYSISTQIEDDIVLGYWLSGGVPVSINSDRRFATLSNWLGKEDLNDILQKAGVKVEKKSEESKGGSGPKAERFTLAGRPELEKFLNEHVIDIVENQERYKALGIQFPSAIILHGPPGCGKTYAIERLVEYLEWPNFQIEASTVASPYIHETSKKVAAIFEQAMDNSPSVIVIDEMEAFLTDRQAGAGHHHVEEVAEFLRRIPEAAKNNVLVIGMTNSLNMIDPAILRRGRFDHVVKVGMASEIEVLALLEKLLEPLPKTDDIILKVLADGLSNRPLSDVAFVVREGARLAARSGKEKIDQECLQIALDAAPSRSQDEPPRKIGFLV